MGPKTSIVTTAMGLSAILFTSLAWSVPVQQSPTFRTRTDLVELDVSVLDRNRRPVRGLTARDFTVLEDGKPQEVSIFEPIDVPDAAPPPAPWMRDVTPDVMTNEPRVTRLWVVVVDDALIPHAPYVMKSSRQIVRDVIEKFGPGDLASIVFTGNSRRAQDFTGDRAKLLAALDDYFPGLARWLPTGPDVNGDWQFHIGALQTLRNVMNTLVAIPHTRKALIWVSPGVPHDFIPQLKFVKPENYRGAPMAEVVARLRIIELAKEVFELGRRANVPVFPIDPCGLGGIAFCTLDGKALGAEEALDFLRTTALQTGGHAITSTNDFMPGINSIFEENKSYYLIGYSPTNAKTDGTFRRLEVKVNREHVEVRTRSSYFAPKPGDGPPRNTSEALARATAESVPVRDLPLRVTVAPFANPGGRNAAIAIALGVRQPVPEQTAKERVSVTTELRTSAFTTEGDARGAQRHTAKVVLRAGAQGDADYEALSRIDLPPGRYRLRLAARHDGTARTGTVMVDVIVPDFFRDAASMSGVVLSATPGRPSAPRDLLAGILPLIPTAQRSFEPTERATALFYLYQNAGRPMVPAHVAIRITDGHGAALITDARSAAVDRFIEAQAQAEAQPMRPTAGGTRSVPAIGSGVGSRNSTLRAAEFRYQLPIDRLRPGPYLLTFEATMGTAISRRDVQFEVK